MKSSAVLIALISMLAGPSFTKDKPIEFPQKAFSKWLTDHKKHPLLAEMNGQTIKLEWDLYSLGSTNGDKIFNKSNGKQQVHSISRFYLPNGKILFYHYKIWEYHYSRGPNRPSYLEDELTLRVASYFFEKRRELRRPWSLKYELVAQYDGLNDRSEEEARSNGVEFLKKRYNLATDFFWW